MTRLVKRLLRRAIWLPEPVGAQGVEITNWPRWSNELLQQVLHSISECTDAEEPRRVHGLIVDSCRSRVPFLGLPRGLCDILSRARGDNSHWY